jgi:hypothetical protein
MADRPAKFRQHDLTRALRAAHAAGLHRSGYEIDPATGKIIVNTGATAVRADEFEKWKAAHADEA